MRSSLLSAVRQITSSRQSPKISAQRHGVDLVPLLETHPSATSSGDSLSVFQSHLVMRLESSNSRSVSPSHQTPKLQERGLRWETVSPLTFQTPERPGPD